MGDRELYAQFANSAYDYDLDVKDSVGFSSNFTVIATSHGNWTGYDGFAAFNPKECRVVVANGGTETTQIMDLVADYLLATKGVNIQLGDSIALTKVAVTAAQGAGCQTVTVVQRAVGWGSTPPSKAALFTVVVG